VCAGVSPSMGLAAAAGRSVESPRRPSYSVDGSHLLWSGGASAAVGGRSTTTVAGDRSSRLSQSRSDEHLRGKARRHVVLASSPCGGPHGGGDGEPRAGGVAHPRGVFDVASTAAQSPQWRCRVLLRWLLLRLEIDACSEALRSSTALVWTCGRCCGVEGIAVGTGAAWAGFLSVQLLGGRRCCNGAAVVVPRVRRRCSGDCAWRWR
jgi:hypothetical protein